MTNRFSGIDAATASAMGGAAVIGAQYIGGKAARDALFLGYFEPTALPLMIIGTSLFAIALVVISSKTLGRVAPGVYVPAAFGASAALLLAIWGLTDSVPQVAAPLLYLLVSGVGPMLGSGFWLMASERFDPRTAKKRFGLIGAAGTAGGLLGGLIAARLSTVAGVDALLPLLAVLNAVCAWQTRSWARVPGQTRRLPAKPTASPTRSGLRILADTHYLRNLAFLVLLGTIAAAFVDYVFKVQVKASFGPGPGLGSFFSLYYAAVSLFSFALQAFGSRIVLEKLGLSAAMGAPSLTFVAGGTAALLSPGLPAIVATRGAEAVFRGSLLRSGYEVFYTPVPPDDKRAVKAVVDVGVDRSGDIVGAGIIQILLWAAVEGQLGVLLGLAVGCSVAAVVLANRLSRGYVSALEHSLVNRAVEIDLEDVEDRLTRTVLLKTLHQSRMTPSASSGTSTVQGVPSATTEREMQEIRTLLSRDADAVRRVFRRDGALPPSLVPHAIRLLEWDPVADDAVRALRGVAEERVGELIDTLVDPNQPFAVRRRLARVFSVCTSQRAVDGLLLGLEDLRFEVRFQCGRSLAAVTGSNPRVRIDPARVSALVQREVAVSHRVWESRKLIDDANAEDRSPLEDLVGDRASRALAHVFTLLGLILPAEPLRIAYRGLHTTDKSLRGTALEYLESVLPKDIRVRLWPFLEGDGTPAAATTRGRDDILQDLLRSNESILLNLEQLQRKPGDRTVPT